MNHDGSSSADIGPISPKCNSWVMTFLLCTKLSENGSNRIHILIKWTQNRGISKQKWETNKKSQTMNLCVIEKRKKHVKQRHTATRRKIIAIVSRAGAFDCIIVKKRKKKKKRNESNLKNVSVNFDFLGIWVNECQCCPTDFTFSGSMCACAMFRIYFYFCLLFFSAPFS